MGHGVGMEAGNRRIEVVIGDLVHCLGELGADAAHRPCLVDHKKAMRLGDALGNRGDVERHDGAQIDDFRLDPFRRERLGRLERLLDELAGRRDRQVAARTGDPRHAEGDEVLADRHLALGGEQRLGLHHEHRVRRAERGLHQRLGVGGIGRHADDEAGHMGPHRDSRRRCGAGRRCGPRPCRRGSPSVRSSGRCSCSGAWPPGGRSGRQPRT